MQRRDEIKLTPEAKEAARALVAAWNAGEVDQQFSIVEIHGDDQVLGSFVFSDAGHSDFDAPRRSLLSELAQLRLLRITQIKRDTWEILLLQELRDAVQNDFARFRDVPIAVTGAIGTFINGSLTMAEGAVFSSSAYGDVTVTFQTLPEELLKLLGADALRPEIANAINALKEADEPTRLEKAGKVIEELGRGLAHLSNTGGALAAIALIARMLSGGGL